MTHTMVLHVWSVATDGPMFDVRLVEDLNDPNREKVHLRYPRGVPCPFRMGSRWTYSVEEDTGEVHVREVREGKP